MIDRKLFFTSFPKAFEHQLSAFSKDAVEDIFNAFEAQGLTDRRWLAYILATAYHETGTSFIRGKAEEKDTTNPAYQKVKKLLTSRDYAASLVEGMVNGTFSGKKLTDYFNDRMIDWRQARRIINGTNQAEEVMNHAIRFFVCLRIHEEYPLAQAS